MEREYSIMTSPMGARSEEGNPLHILVMKSWFVDEEGNQTFQRSETYKNLTSDEVFARIKNFKDGE